MADILALLLFEGKNCL